MFKTCSILLCLFLTNFVLGQSSITVTSVYTNGAKSANDYIDFFFNGTNIVTHKDDRIIFSFNREVFDFNTEKQNDDCYFDKVVYARLNPKMNDGSKYNMGGVSCPFLLSSAINTGDIKMTYENHVKDNINRYTVSSYVHRPTHIYSVGSPDFTSSIYDSPLPGIVGNFTFSFELSHLTREPLEMKLTGPLVIPEGQKPLETCYFSSMADINEYSQFALSTVTRENAIFIKMPLFIGQEKTYKVTCVSMLVQESTEPTHVSFYFEKKPRSGKILVSNVLLLPAISFPTVTPLNLEITSPCSVVKQMCSLEVTANGENVVQDTDIYVDFANVLQYSKVSACKLTYSSDEEPEKNVEDGTMKGDLVDIVSKTEEVNVPFTLTKKTLRLSVPILSNLTKDTGFVISCGVQMDSIYISPTVNYVNYYVSRPLTQFEESLDTQDDNVISATGSMLFQNKVMPYTVQGLQITSVFLRPTYGGGIHAYSYDAYFMLQFYNDYFVQRFAKLKVRTSDNRYQVKSVTMKQVDNDDQLIFVVQIPIEQGILSVEEIINYLNADIETDLKELFVFYTKSVTTTLSPAAVSASAYNGIQDFSETDVDCGDGGFSAKCSTGKRCRTDADCEFTCYIVGDLYGICSDNAVFSMSLLLPLLIAIVTMLFV